MSADGINGAGGPKSADALSGNTQVALNDSQISQLSQGVAGYQLTADDVKGLPPDIAKALLNGASYASLLMNV